MATKAANTRRLWLWAWNQRCAALADRTRKGYPNKPNPTPFSSNAMSMIGRLFNVSSAELQEELSALSRDPLARLSQGEVRIPPYDNFLVEPFHMALLLIIVWFVGGWIKPADQIVLMAISSATCVFFLIWRLTRIYPKKEIVLTREHVEFKSRNRTVQCPWSLFDAAGKPHLPQSLHHKVGTMTLPVNRAAVPEVKLLCDWSVVETGAQVRTRFFRMSPPNQVEVLNGTDLETSKLATLLMTLGRKLGPICPLHETAGYSVVEDSSHQPAADGWATVGLTGMVFPHVCCGCGQSANKHLELTPRSLRSVFLTTVLLGHFHEIWSDIRVPICRSCRFAKNFKAFFAYTLLAVVLVGVLTLAIVGPNDWSVIPGSCLSAGRYRLFWSTT
jgi:hypothetical protein